MLTTIFRPTVGTRSEDSSGRDVQNLAQPHRKTTSRGKLSLLRTRSSSTVGSFPSTHIGDAEPDLADLNDALLALAELFPDVRPDVFREMLCNLSEESRLHVVADQLLRYGAKWIQGRWRVASKVSSSKILSEVFQENQGQPEESRELIPQEERFRSATYKTAVRDALKEEFQGISRTAIDGVLVEQNFSYTNSRPILTSLAAKSWRFSLKSLMRWKKPSPEQHFMLVRSKPTAEESTMPPQLKKTGSVALDKELYDTILKPLIDARYLQYERDGMELAVRLNFEEATSNQATFECECCFDDVAFESIAFCSTGEHQLCFKCLQNTVSAALYAQAWAKTIDHERSQVLCFAPSAKTCSGCIPLTLTERAILQTRGGQRTWAEFERRLANDAIQTSGGNYQRCPFCNYAEVDDVCYPPGMPRYKLKRIANLSSLFLLLLIFCCTISLCWQYFWLSKIFPLPRLRSSFRSALKSLARKNCLSPRFKCRNPSCSRASCRLCRVAWRDPHKCNEREELSLRTTVEAARSAAMKRVCPKCNLSFVKESGCNKMTCTCGYTMCYLCRQGLGQQAPSLANAHQNHDYSHFCGHFRALPGRCSQCNKCDLYREENQDEIVRRAGEAAEKEWRAKIGKKSNDQKLAGVDIARNKGGPEGKLQGVIDYLAETYITCSC